MLNSSLVILSDGLLSLIEQAISPAMILSIKPAHYAPSSYRYSSKCFMAFNTKVMTDFYTGWINKTNPRWFSFNVCKVSTQWG